MNISRECGERAALVNEVENLRNLLKVWKAEGLDKSNKVLSDMNKTRLHNLETALFLEEDIITLSVFDEEDRQ